VNKEGKVIERFLGIKHVKEIISEELKTSIVEVCLVSMGYTFPICEVGYDVASNMRGEFNGLQKLIHDETHMPSISIALLINFNWWLFPSQDVAHLLNMFT
jgi:hypothetical protein